MNNKKKNKYLFALAGVFCFTIVSYGDVDIELLQEQIMCKESIKIENKLVGTINDKDLSYVANMQRYNRCMQRALDKAQSNKSLYNAAAEDYRRPDYKRELDKSISNCNANKAKSCAIAGDMYNTGRGTVKNIEKAAEFYDKGCKLGHMTACGSVAAIGLDSAVGPYARDSVAAKNLLIKSCDSGVGLSCSIVGGLYLKDRDYGKVREYCAKGCSLENGQGCSWLGMVFKAGLGVPRDYNEAGKYLKMGCTRGHAQGCAWYSELLDKL